MKRYNPSYDDYDMQAVMSECPTGEYVKYTDVQKLVEAAKEMLAACRCISVFCMKGNECHVCRTVPALRDAVGGG